MQKGTLGGSTEFTTAAGFIVVRGFFLWVSPPKSMLGIPFQKNALKPFCLKGEVLATHCFSSCRASCAHTQRPSFPDAQIHAPACHCLSAVLQTRRDPSAQESNQHDADFFIPSWLNDLINSPRIALEMFYLFYFLKVSLYWTQCMCGREKQHPPAEFRGF